MIRGFYSKGSFITGFHENPKEIFFTTDNEFIPNYAVVSNKNTYSSKYYTDIISEVARFKVATSDEGEDDALYGYYKPLSVVEKYGDSLPNMLEKKFPSLIRHLNFSNKVLPFSFKYLKEDVVLTVTYGFIADKTTDNILLVVVSKDKDNFYNTDFINKKEVKVFCNYDLITDNKYKLFFDKLKKEYLTDYIELGIEIIFMSNSNIKEKCYKQQSKKEFSNIGELENYTKNIQSLIRFDSKLFYNTLKNRFEEIIEETDENVIEDAIVEKEYTYE